MSIVQITRNKNAIDEAFNPTTSMYDITLTAEEVDRAYREGEMYYAKTDAEQHVMNVIEDIDDSVSVNTETWKQWLYPDIEIEAGRYDNFYSVMAHKFLDNHDCNVADNALWDNIVPNHLDDMFKEKLVRYIVISEPYIESNTNALRALNKLIYETGMDIRTVSGTPYTTLNEIIIHFPEDSSGAQSALIEVLSDARISWETLFMYCVRWLPAPPENSYSSHEDDDFLCERNDAVDNAAYKAVCSVLTNTDKDTVSRDIENYLAEFDDMLNEEQLDEAIPTTHEIIVKIAKAQNLPLGEEPEWNAAYLGEINDATVTLLRQIHGEPCHPFIDDDEHICYSTSEKCEYCPYNIAGQYVERARR